MIYLVVRIGFDNMENRSPRYETIVGYSVSEETAKAFVSAQQPPNNRGWDGDMYPKWEIKPIKELP